MSVLDLTTSSHDDSLTTATNGSNQTLYNTWNVLPLMLQCCKTLWMCLEGRSSCAHVHPIDILLGMNPANRQVKVMSERCGTAETPNTCNILPGTAIPLLTFMYGMT